MSETIVFQPEDIARTSENNYRPPLYTDKDKQARIEEISKILVPYFTNGELGVYLGTAIAYLALDGDEDKFLEYCKLEEDEGIQEKYPKALDKLKRFKNLHPELF